MRPLITLWGFHENLFSDWYVILLTDRQPFLAASEIQPLRLNKAHSKGKAMLVNTYCHFLMKNKQVPDWKSSSDASKRAHTPTAQRRVNIEQRRCDTLTCRGTHTLCFHRERCVQEHHAVFMAPSRDGEAAAAWRFAAGASAGLRCGYSISTRT